MPCRAARTSAWVCLVLCGSGASGAIAALANLPSVADTTLSEFYPNNNLGSLPQVNAGVTQNGTRNRGLFKFDLAGAIPAGSRIRSAAVVLEVTGVSVVQSPFADFSLYRVLKPWGEGQGISPTNCNSCAGQGAPAATNEATWHFRYAFTTNSWASPGAEPVSDYTAVPSATQTIYGRDSSPYSFGPSAQMTADLQTWRDEPQANFGWILICQDESTPFTARRFGSREDTGFAPRLEVDYLAPPRIEAARIVTNAFRLLFLALSDQGYRVEFSDSIAPANWQTLATIPPPNQDTNIVVTDGGAAPGRFYRVATFP